MPLERDNLFATGHYAINDWVGFFGQALFSKVQTHSIQQPSPSVNGWAAFIPVDGRSIPAELALRSCQPAQSDRAWRLTYYLDYANRDLRVDVITYNLLAGFEGTIPAIDWTWEVYGSKGESETAALTTGVASLERFRAVISAPNWGQGFDRDTAIRLSVASARISRPARAASIRSTRRSPISQDCKDAVTANLKTRSTMQQDIWEANAQGKVVDMWAGELRAAVGASYRQTRYEFINDTMTSQGVGFNDQALGIYPSGDASGEDTVKEFYGEVLVPLLKDVPAAHAARSGARRTRLRLRLDRQQHHLEGTRQLGADQLAACPGWLQPGRALAQHRRAPSGAVTNVPGGRGGRSVLARQSVAVLGQPGESQWGTGVGAVHGTHGKGRPGNRGHLLCQSAVLQRPSAPRSRSPRSPAIRTSRRKLRIPGQSAWSSTRRSSLSCGGSSSVDRLLQHQGGRRDRPAVGRRRPAPVLRSGVQPDIRCQ